MNLKELHSFKLSDAIHFHDELNPVIFNGDDMKPEVRETLFDIANDFIDHLGINELDVKDITISGSSAGYSYTKQSDIDLHILVDMNSFNDDDVYRELFDAKKTVYNDAHDIRIGGYEVELYVQDTNKPVISLGEYSILHDKWLKLPKKRKAHFDQAASKLKYDKLVKLAEFALKSNNHDKIQSIIRTVKKYRQSGLDMHGEFGPENIAYKALRNNGYIQKLYDALDVLHSKELSLPESVVDTSIEDSLLESWNNYVSECSGYIPSEREKNDPRWERALSVDIHPDTMKKQAKKFGWKISRAGIPPSLRV